mgnify:CR=1 FL=1
MNARLLPFAGAVLFLCAGLLHAETRKLTRDDCVLIALENHPTMMVLAQDQEAASPRLAAYLAEIGWEQLARGDHDDPITMSPIYLHQDIPYPIPANSNHD